MTWLLLAPAELQARNDVGRAGQAGGERCRLHTQQAASIIDTGSERHRPFKVGIPEEAQQLEMQVCSCGPAWSS